jgi:hypothetical protein
MGRRSLKGVASLAPGAFLVLLPKCPLCVAAWIAAGTGITLPAVLAGGIRPALAIACAGSILLLARRASGRLRSILSPDQ